MIRNFTDAFTRKNKELNNSNFLDLKNNCIEKFSMFRGKSQETKKFI